MFSLEGEGYESTIEQFGDKSHEETVDDQLSLSSHEPLVLEFSDPNEEKFDEIPEDLVATSQEDLDVEDFIESYAFHLDIKEESCDNVHLHKDIPTAIIIF